MRNEQEIQNKIDTTDFVIMADEAGAGCLCGNLVVCAIVLPKLHGIEGLNDSKKLTEKKREFLYPQIINKALDYCVIRITPEEVDCINILQARMEGFRQAINGICKVNASYAVIDGNKKPDGLSIEVDFLIKADAKLEGVSAASIIAKVTRDREINELAKIFPYSQYSLEKHKGYGTKLHMEALQKYGPIKGFHRFSYQPVKDSIKL